MKTNRINSQDWQAKLNQVSKKLDNRNINIEVIGFDIGDQILAKSVHLKGLTYEPKYNTIEITSEKFEHNIHSPSEIYFTSNDENIESIESIEIIDSKNRKQIISFDAPLLLTK